ncbi:surfeit locus protein 1 [Centruroides vittatus]|uniref:surfeit locus protein 1 n=1 Tax=Centruroides vittatus TaxID=120091 RepID=UPI00351077EA
MNLCKSYAYSRILKSSCLFEYKYKWKLLNQCRPVSTVQAHHDRSNRKWGPVGYFLLIIPVTAFGLGTWQIYRRRWKLKLIEELERKTTAAPISLPEDLREIKDLEYRKIRVKGRFDHSKEMYITPRSLVISGGKESRTNFFSSGQSGSFVVTPFILSDRNLTILVNRGWVPKKKTFSSTREEGQIKDELEIEGVVRLTEKRPPFAIKQTANPPFWYHRDVDGMAYSVRAAPVFIDAVAESTVPGGPIGGQTRVTLRNEHFSYIITWYSLSAATSFMWYRKFILGKPLL